ncbi:peptide chain release factor 2 [Bulleidia sp. zg-1006]|uniref:peptide chain release factor 2 n=1 Tax=Bulleidia sp. zg-1006 TaxID=2806552 RepID=UPI001EEE8D07|nr:peptide chain release factor 2 [Bulleidia sp. zg-1006]
MELYELKQILSQRQAKLESLGSSLDLTAKKEEIQKNNDLMAQEDFWNDQKKAQRIIKENNGLKDLVSQHEKLTETTLDLLASVTDLQASLDEDMKELVEEEFLKYNMDYANFEVRVLLSGPYDDHNAILEIHPGAGGTEAMDWAGMLYRMYTRFAERRGYQLEVMDYQPGEEAGVKSVSMRISGNMAYGYLKAENGVHRLVRISPFDSNARRHTSFASVEIMPEFEDDLEIELDEKDLEVITMRSSGAGGQHINKTDSAVRMTHKPSGITVFSQSQRSQLQNRETCLNMLKSKLLQLKIREQEQRASEIKGEVKANEWGSQIRSYVFAPYTMVKDLRTGYEVGNVQSVMDGDIEGFIDSYLRSQL